MPFTRETFAGKVALVTGSSSGIGAGIALQFASLGCVVSLHGRDEAALNGVRDKCIEAGLTSQQVLCTIGDVASYEFLQTLVQRTVDHFKRLDILVNNAGMPDRSSIESITPEAFDLVINVNLKSMIFLTELCVPHLEKTTGNVVNISSLYAMSPAANCIAYCVSKAGMDNATKSAALQLAPKGIRVNAVNPGFVRTAIFKRAVNDDAIVDMVYQMAKKSNPMGRVGEPSDIAKVVSFLASNDDASWMTGVCVPVDGGTLLSRFGFNNQSKPNIPQSGSQ